MVAKRCPCGCNRLEVCPAGERMLAEKAARQKKHAAESWEEHHAKYGRLWKNPRWRKLRAEFIASHPACARCGAPATDVHHTRPHGGDLERFLDPRNLEPLCKSCHARATRAQATASRTRGRKKGA